MFCINTVDCSLGMHMSRGTSKPHIAVRFLRLVCESRGQAEEFRTGSKQTWSSLARTDRRTSLVQTDVARAVRASPHWHGYHYRWRICSQALIGRDPAAPLASSVASARRWASSSFRIWESMGPGSGSGNSPELLHVDTLLVPITLIKSHAFSRPDPEH